MSLSMDRKRLFDSQMFIEHRLAWGVVDRRGVSEATFIDLFLLSSCQVQHQSAPPHAQILAIS